MQFKEVTTLKTNITSSLDLRPSNDRFGIMTKQLAKNSSKYIYRLEIYDFFNTTNKNSTDVYETYDESKHFIRFVADKNLVAVTTKFEIKFYQIIPLQLKKSIPHHQQNLYDLQVSVDGQLVSLIGNHINMWRTNGFRKVFFPHVITSARYCTFSRDNTYIGIATNNQINIYLFQKLTGEYDFIQISTIQVSDTTLFLTSINFSPIDSNIMVVGFLNVSPQLFKVDTGTFSQMKDIQPLSSNNAKVATFMPDGKRFLSSDFRNGIGIWPGLQQTLFYQEGLLLYDLKPSNGSRFIGYVWQQIKILDITIECKSQIFNSSCPCTKAQTSWDYTSYSCKTLVCLQNQFSTGVKQNGDCVCMKGYTFNKTLRKCLIDCSLIPNAVNVISTNGQCFCVNNLTWNQTAKTCDFVCNKIPYTLGQQGDKKCLCKTGFQWSQSLNQCICPKYTKNINNACVCYDNYFEDETGKCIIDCSKLTNSNGSLPSQQQCQCKQGYYFSQINQVMGCKLNCTSIKNTLNLNNDFDTCICYENMNWDSKNKKCNIDCTKVPYASGVSTALDNACKCAVNYLWVEEINQCGKNCTGLSFVDLTKKSTLRSCPCIEKFNWNIDSKMCQIDCKLVANASKWASVNSTVCQCQQGFNWVKNDFSCQIDCSKIWDASTRVNDSFCRCNNGKTFNQTQLTCQLLTETPFFSSIWVIVGFVLCAIIILSMVIVLVKYCWNFETKNNKEHAKRLKTNDNLGEIKKRKTKRIQTIEQGDLITNQRLRIKSNT